MKFLKKINEFYYKSDGLISDTIDDILLEINDVPKFTSFSWGEDNSLVVVIKLSEDDDHDIDEDEGIVINDDIKESIRRIIDFMSSNGYNYVMEIGTDDIPPGAQDLQDYNRKFTYEELNDDFEMWVNEYIRIDFIKE